MNWVAVLLCSSLLVALYRIYFNRVNYRRLPGPWGLPLLGNVFQLDRNKPWVTYTKWRKIYGDMFSLNVAGQTILILSSQKVVQDLLDRRSSKYADRPKWFVINELTGEMDFPLMRYGELWRRMRRASDMALNIKMSSNYHLVQAEQSLLFVHGLLDKPENWEFDVQRTSISIVLSLIYDIPPIKSLDEPPVIFMDHLVTRTSEAVLPGAYLVEIFPILSRLPLFFSKWKRDAQRDFAVFTKWFEDMFLPIKEKFIKGQEQPASFCATLAETQTRHGMSDLECAWLAGILYGAGQETTATALKWFFLCMVLYPDVQDKAQEELDRVIGRARLPSFSDMKHLPYIRAIVKEILRWQSPLPVGLPHMTMEDDYYRGYLIPKGTICIANVMGLNHDPEIYGPDSGEFHPERFLDEEGLIKDETSEGHFTYGFGHRICVGRHVANNSLFILIATTLWSMRIEAVKDGNGNVIKPDLEGDQGLFWRPRPFRFTTKPLFDDAEGLIQQARDDMLQETPTRAEV